VTQVPTLAASYTCQIYPGGIANATTLRCLVVLLDDFGVREFTFILNQGFYSAVNIDEKSAEKICFLLPLSFSTRIAARLISQHHQQLQSPLHAFYYKRRPIFHLRYEITISEAPVASHLFRNKKESQRRWNI